ncbi:STAS domain-containing protein [Shinella sedimenti]|uniref:STAS domain-containing protein n=1 Tax=Shinella sedimenti TaxID=2919913 RepID=A0ABT0CRB2_9HYPH|nr:STAS domain-containing protein [Shinella sedimenti]MCJ8151148.1 STAS domain-containing protein [Shinella sedimenti]
MYCSELADFTTRNLQFIKYMLGICAGNYFTEKPDIEASMSSPAPDHASLTLPKTLTIKNILDVREKILSAVDNNGELVLEIADDAQVDLSFVQLVVAARSHATQKTGRVLLARPATGELREALRRGGFLDELTPDASQFWLHQEQTL